MFQHELSEMEELTSTRLSLEVGCSISSSPSIYRGGTVDLDAGNMGSPVARFAVLTSIVCEADYWHLSPEELRFQDLKIHLDPPRWEISYEEQRLRYYFDGGLTSHPQFGPPMPTPTFSVTSPVNPTPSDSESGHLGLGYPIPPIVVEESATSTRSLSAARIDAEVEGDEEVETTSEGSDNDTPTSSTSHHSDTREKKKRKGISRRDRRLEKTVESLSSLALTEVQSCTTTADDRKIDDSHMVDAPSGLSTVVNQPDSTTGTSEPDATLPHPSEPAVRRHESAPQPQHNTSANLGTAENNSIATENDSSISISSDRPPITGLLDYILDCKACHEVYQIFKWAEAHPGLRKTQLFDLLWVANNFFNVHGGIMIYCLQISLVPMDDISAETGLSAWSQDPKLMQKLDESYCKHLRPHIDTVGSHNNVAKVAWESYCFELGDVFSEQFPDWESATSFFQNLSQEHDLLGPMITSSYLEDLSALWTQVHPALLEVTGWLEPFIDYGPDYHRSSSLYDATIILGRHARVFLNRKDGITEPTIDSARRATDLMRLLYKHRSGELKLMQYEMESIMNRVNSRDVDLIDAGSADGEVAALVDRAKQATLWRVEDPRASRIQDALARREIRVMRSYRPKLLREGTAAARIRGEMFDVLTAGAEGKGEAEVFWDGCDAVRRSNWRDVAPDWVTVTCGSGGGYEKLTPRSFAVLRDMSERALIL